MAFCGLLANTFHKFRLPNTTEELKGRIRQQVEKIMQVQQELSALGTLYKHKKQPEQLSLHQRLLEYEVLLNALVYEAYGLTADEIAIEAVKTESQTYGV
jgi:hypothetical protein